MMIRRSTFATLRTPGDKSPGSFERDNKIMGPHTSDGKLQEPLELDLNDRTDLDGLDYERDRP